LARSVVFPDSGGAQVPFPTFRNASIEIPFIDGRLGIVLHVEAPAAFFFPLEFTDFPFF